MQPRSWISSFLAVMALCVLVLACSRGNEEPVTAQQQPTSAPNLGVNVVQHQRAEVDPKIQWRSSGIPRAAMSLTAGDGTGLRLVSITGTVVIEDPLAFTELRLTFDNPERRRREGRFEIDLPQDAALSRLAMRVQSGWLEGEVVERTKARLTFETFIHTRPKVDPALLEKASANRVSARVFPILPLERKEIIVSYSQPVSGGDAFRMPLQGLPELDALDLKVIVKTVDAAVRDRFPAAAQRVIEVRERDFAPSRDLVVDLQGAGEAAALRAAELVAVRVRPRALRGAEPITGLTVLFDTSASSARSFDEQVDELGAMLESLGQTPVTLVAFDQTVEVVHDGPAAAALGDPLAGLRERRAFGASALHAALSHDAIRGAVHHRLLVWSDGIATAGPTEPTVLAEAAAALGVDRIDAFASTTSADKDALAAIATAGPNAGIVVGPGPRGAEVVEALTHRAFDDVAIDVPGAVWWWPQNLDGVSPGDDVLVYAGFEDCATEEVRVAFSDPRLPDHVVPTLDGAVPLVQRAVAAARVEQLERELAETTDDAAADRLRQRLVNVAVDHRLLTKHTALLVLENEAEYRRYGIDRSALADIVTVGPGGVDLLRRGSGPTGVPLPPVVADADEPPTGNLDRNDDAAGGTGSRNALPQMARELDPDRSVLGLLQQQSGHFLTSPYGAGLSVGNDNEDVWGGLTGTEVGEAFGVGGLGLVGSGRGGGGVGEGTIGLGNTGLIGRGGGGGTGRGYGIGSGAGGGDDASGAGLVSIGGSGYGRGAGAGFGGRGRRVPRVRQAKATVTGSLDKDIVRRIVRSHINEVRHCYNQGLVRDPNLKGRVAVKFNIGPTGTVPVAVVADSSLEDTTVANCIAKATKRWNFPKPTDGGNVEVTYPFVLDPGGGGGLVGRHMSHRRTARRRPGDPTEIDSAKWAGSAQSGRFAEVQSLVAAGRTQDARVKAWDWATTEPDNSLALIALGEALELTKRPALAARVYGSLIDLHPHRADIRRAAASRLEAVGEQGRGLAIDSYQKALAQRPDQINGHRLLAWALVKDGQYEEAFDILTQGLDTAVPAGRFNGVKSLLAEDRRLVAAAWLASLPEHDRTVTARLHAAGVRPATEPSLRVVADWETDATDVDILCEPMGKGDGRRHADVRTGFGPEAWISRGRKVPTAVSARVRYFNRGAMGYAMGSVSAISHDGTGKLRFSDRPFLLMEAHGSVDLGRFEA